MRTVPAPRPSPLTRLPSGHFRLGATHLGLREPTPLLGCLHHGCQTFCVDAQAPGDGPPRHLPEPGGEPTG